jgi:hypothetical protein
MPDQLTLATQADGGFEAHRKATRRDMFLAEMDKVVPWSELCAVIEPFYPKVRRKADVVRWVWSGCCASTSCSSGMR